MKKRIQRLIRVLQRYATRWWYGPMIAALAFADLFLVVVPTDGLLVSAVMLHPRRWFYTAAAVTLGSSLGAVVLAHILSVHGLPFLLHLTPGIEHSHAWIWTSDLMTKWGAWALFVIAVGPIPQHPAIAMAALSKMSFLTIFAAVFAGRLLKYGFLAWLATYAPGVLGKIWGLHYELDECNVASAPTENCPKSLPEAKK